MNTLDWMDDELVSKIAPTIVKEHPNTYTFTKQLAESVVYEARNELPITIVRPSIVVSTYSDPFPGWIDNTFGPTGLVIAYGKGYLKSILSNRDMVAGFVPVDYTVNLILSAGWYRGSNRVGELKVYNGSTGNTNPLYWGNFEENLYKSLIKYPYENSRASNGVFTKSKLKNFLIVFFEQTLLAYLMDLYLKVTNQKTKYLSFHIF